MARVRQSTDGYELTATSTTSTAPVETVVKPAADEFARFKAFATKLVRVPKSEIEKQDKRD